MSIESIIEGLIDKLNKHPPNANFLKPFLLDLKEACTEHSAAPPAPMPSQETAVLVWFLLPQFLDENGGYDTVIEVIQLLLKHKLPRDIFMMGIPYSDDKGDVIPCGYDSSQCQMMAILLYEMKKGLTTESLESLESFDTDKVVSAIMTHAYHFISSTFDEAERQQYKANTKELLVQLYMFGIQHTSEYLPAPVDTATERFVMPPVPIAGTSAQLYAISNPDITNPPVTYVPHDKLHVFFS